MKKLMKMIPILLLVFLLTGCQQAKQEDFIFYNDYLETEALQFDQYFIFYEDDSEGVTIYGVRDNLVVDSEGTELINYIVKRETVNGEFRLICGDSYLESGTIRSSSHGEIDIIPGQEIYDYCLENIFTITLPSGRVIAREIKRDVNDLSITWLDVEDVSSRNFIDYTLHNYSLFLMIIAATIASLLLFSGYKMYYRKNYNNFTKGVKVKRLPGVIMVGITLLVLTFLSYIIIITEYDEFTYNTQNNLYDYVIDERNTDYLAPFINDDYTLLEKGGDLEVYLNVISNDQKEYIIVIVDGENKYIADVMYYDYVDASNVDSYRVEVYQKEGEIGGMIYGYIIAGYNDIDGVLTETSAYSVAVVESVDGETEFVDFMDSTNQWVEYLKNRKGYYQINVGRAEVYLTYREE